MKPFTKYDWYGFAGAEEVENKPALIGYSGDYIIVADVNGIGVYPSDTVEAFGIELPYEIAKIVAEKLETLNITKELLVEELGFTQY